MSRNNRNISDLKIISYINTIITFTSSVLTILSFYGFYKGHQIYNIVLGIVLFSATILIFCKRYTISKSFLVYLMNKTVPKPNIEIKDKKVIYECIDNDRYSFKSNFYINVTGDTPINFYRDRLKWTAGLIETILPTVKGQKIEFDEEPLSHSLIDNQEFTILFENNKYISKNDAPYKVGFKIPLLVDQKHIAKPILNVGIYYVTRNLTLRVEFNKKMHPIKVRGLKYAHFIDKSPYDTVNLDVEYDDTQDKKYVEFYIQKPIYGGLYSIDWELED